jgi:hypothetical protein
MEFSIKTEHEEEHLVALNGWRYRQALQEYDTFLKWVDKADKELTTEECRDKLFEILEDNDVTLYD